MSGVYSFSFIPFDCKDKPFYFYQGAMAVGICLIIICLPGSSKYLFVYGRLFTYVFLALWLSIEKLENIAEYLALSFKPVVSGHPTIRPSDYLPAIKANIYRTYIIPSKFHYYYFIRNFKHRMQILYKSFYNLHHVISHVPS